MKNIDIPVGISNFAEIRKNKYNCSIRWKIDNPS